MAKFSSSTPRLAAAPAAAAVGHGQAATVPSIPTRGEASWFDSSWELRQGLEIAEVDPESLPPEWVVAPTDTSPVQRG